jgi:uncharacterized lipoprotein YmbA
MTRLLPLILAILLTACASPRPAAPVLPSTEGAEPADPDIRPLSTEMEELGK